MKKRYYLNLNKFARFMACVVSGIGMIYVWIEILLGLAGMWGVDMYIAELPKDVQTIIKWAIQERLIMEYDGFDVYRLQGDINNALDSKVEDIMYLFESEV
jgi:hypothetical protein